jgi:hypothetical protein
MPSRGYAALLLLIHALAAACLLTVLTGWTGIAAALLITALGAVTAWDRALLRSARSPCAIELGRSGEGRCVLRSGTSVALQNRGGARVTRYWVALHTTTGVRRGLLLPAGMLRPGDARLLRLWALWGRLPGVAAGQLAA